MKKILKYLAITLGILFGIYLVLCFIGPKEMSFSNSIEIAQTPDVAFNEVADYKNWSHWSAWSARDPKMTSTFEGNPMEVGYSWQWKSESEGNGSQKITSVEPNVKVISELRFEGFDHPNESTFLFEPTSLGTKVTWKVEMGEVSFFFRGMMFLFEGAIKEDFITGLSRLKQSCEN